MHGAKGRVPSPELESFQALSLTALNTTNPTTYGVPRTVYIRV